MYTHWPREPQNVKRKQQTCWLSGGDRAQHRTQGIGKYCNEGKDKETTYENVQDAVKAVRVNSFKSMYYEEKISQIDN